MSLSYQIQVPPPQHAKYKSNYISTTKYNIFTYIPLSLIIQFKRYANIYFLVCAVLQSIPLISPLSPFSAVAPLIFVLMLSMIREGVEDYNRWKSDKKDNSHLTLVYRGHEFEKCKWQDLKCGDFIKIMKDQIISADTLILLSSNHSGIAYVETSSLDGEKNLKPKFSQSSMQMKYNMNNQLIKIQNIQGSIKCIQPSAQIEAFEGEVDFPMGESKIIERINKKNMMLRGCKLKNTEWVIGIIIYTGQDTAIMMNGSTPFTKTSNIEKKVNNIILIIFAFQVLCSFGSAVFGYFGCSSEIPFGSMVLGSEINCPQQAGIAFGAYFILFSTFIPISLIVSLQFVKVFQGYFMGADKQMYCELNDRPMSCKTVSVNEQLGQVEYILTDKTGTLTCNKMQFRNIVIGRQIYGQQLNFDPVGAIDYDMLIKKNTVRGRERTNSQFNDRSLSYDLSLSKQQNQQLNMPQSKRQLIQLMFTMIATCHQCIPVGNGQFQGPSPDEVALLKAAYNMGFKFISCENKMITVQYNQTPRKFQLLKLLQFDSDRKRMTVIVRAQQSICVFVKGADTSIEKVLNPKQRYIDDIRHKTYEMSKTGLRSLWFAYKTYPRDIDVYKLSSEDIQSGLTLVGATGIEDRLQDYVPQTIFSLRQAGIKFIMLTGDKLETAENIARSCKLIEEGYLIRSAKDVSNFSNLIDQYDQNSQEMQLSPVIDGSTISFSQNEVYLQHIIQKAKSAVFCRVTPGQKAEIVKFVKSMGKLTLAIGDGANDVNMIMQANVGVGVYGQEGTRAAQVANYAIGQFCLLWKLLLYHGRLNYIRITQMILYFFYKNMVFTTVQFVFCFYSLGSGQSFWLSWSITFYNLVFTFFPVVIRAVFEVDVVITPTKETFHELSQGTHDNQMFYAYYPKMYFVSQKNKLFNNYIFFAWFFLGFCQGVICLIFTLYSIGDQFDTSGSSSYEVGFYLVQISVYTTVIIVVTVKLAVNVKHWTVILVIGFAVPSLGAYILFTFVMGFFEDAATYESMINLLQMPTFYAVQYLCIGSMFAFDFLLFSLKTTKQSFENYLKFKTLKKQRMSESNLNQYMLEMMQTAERKIQL